MLSGLCLLLAHLGAPGDAAQGPRGARQPLAAFPLHQQSFSPNQVNVSQLLSRFLNN